MKKVLIIVGTVIIAMLIGGWLVFSDGSSGNDTTSESKQKVLEVQDKQLAKGDETAPVKIVEYADILCPYCAKTNEEVIPQLQSDYIDKKQVHYEVRLVAMISPDSQRAAEGAYCAADQDKFWEYLDTAYKDTWDNYYSKNKTPRDVDRFTEANINNFADRIGLDMTSWQQCMDSDTYEKTITANQEQMSENEAYGTPHFIINGTNYNGAPPYTALKAVIDAELNKQKDSE